ncbi:putative pentatricopeptide repeat-containing protein At3g11460, mitochondrial [Prosopis cineraria]|uniref:putative pentatricopeptide repeat-containing protein At3g11460, mitochondrial n=1 Tax=Prosopis cineraria TaxID=364024 RepID=UPI00240F4084|nr:putative pentatricopeptide repeat-containing protein At3g11460, mitochondrial [Prosopis cineraria]
MVCLGKVPSACLAYFEAASLTLLSRKPSNAVPKSCSKACFPMSLFKRISCWYTLDAGFRPCTQGFRWNAPQKHAFLEHHYRLASTGVGNTSLGKTGHRALVIKLGYEEYVVAGNCMLEFYAKSGAMSEARCVFSNMSLRESEKGRGIDVNLVSWTTLTSCFGMHGKGEESLFLFKKMIDIGFTNQVTLIAISASCSHSGLADQGMQIFNSVRSEYKFKPSVKHYACIVDLLGRCGYLVEALHILEGMKSPAAEGIWDALLAGCMMQKNVKIG